VTSPFQSIISALESPVEHQGERDDSRAEVLAEGMRAEKLASVSVRPEEMPSGTSELSAVTELDRVLKALRD
jgi:hypothetical protein